MERSLKNKNVVFFDGMCNLCNGFVDFVIKRDKKQSLLFASLQGETAKSVLPSETSQLRTVIYRRSGNEFKKSTAVLTILKDLGGIWSLAYVFIIIPVFIRNWVYDFVANNRYNWFGKRDVCRVPSPEERNHFID